MNEQEQQPSVPAEPVASEAPTAPTSPYTLRGKKWLFGATLVTVGLVAGSGATYAITSATTPDVQSQTLGHRGGPPGQGGDGTGAPPDGQAPSTQPG